ncbi:hypothetical protein K227x_53450 [Rubripirellula lacrimiformis]|uniref:Uncharacterized protein n=2 Tax=Rubripirellula lacrimiformis TaxID=1930273 RepID=A0A517NIG0_9BACT|nr:hypothetical protein K227x_53450 [Rubripirellula lacrimiformis]
MAAIGFPGIIAIKSLVSIVIAFMTYYWWRNPVALKAPEKRDDVWAFASLNYFGSELSGRTFVHRFLTRAPKNWAMAIQMTGLMLAVIVAAGSLLAIFSWFAIHQWNLTWYRKAYFRTHFAFPFLLLAPIYAAAATLYFKAEHARLRATLAGE